MSFIDTTTKHSASAEKKFAGNLYIYIGFAVLIGIIVAYAIHLLTSA